ncbi:MAG: glycosyltransferase family 39 protein, partial [Oscillospiraceae bacterium]|nr:glycosyltransferase family 39 protein [Oscillospiraceae bacterium]
AQSVAALDFSCFDKFTYFHRFVHMTTFTLVCGLLFRVFGVSVLTIQLASALISGGCIFIIYLIGKKISGEKLGLICALLYAAFIPSIAYCAVFTSENFAMPFLLLSLYFVISAYKNAKIGGSAANMLIAGVFCAVGCLFRGVAPFYLSAYIIGALTVFAKKTKLVSVISLAAAFFVVFSGISSLYYKSGITKYRLTNGGVPFTVYMLVGFNFETGGMFSAEDQNIYFEANKDKDKMAEIVKERLIKRISENKEKIIPLMFKKTNTIFGYGEFNSVYWSYGNNGIDGAKPYLYTLYRTASVYYIMLIMLCLYYAVFSKHKGILCLLALMILGFEGGLMLMEVQSRYTYSVAYVFVIIGAMAVYYFGCHSKNRR